MKLADRRMIAASPDRVWAALLDPQVLQPCIPGCESMTGSALAGYEAVLVQKAGPMSFRVTGIVTLSDIVPGRGATVSAAAKGGKAGVAAGGAKIRLAAEGQGTRLSYEVEANVGGKIAQLGSRIIESFAWRLADQFFERFQAVLDGKPAVAPDAAAKSGWLGRLFAGPRGGGDA